MKTRGNSLGPKHPWNAIFSKKTEVRMFNPSKMREIVAAAASEVGVSVAVVLNSRKGNGALAKHLAAFVAVYDYSMNPQMVVRYLYPAQVGPKMTDHAMKRAVKTVEKNAQKMAAILKVLTPKR